MTLSLKHAFASAKADGTDVTLVQPSNWNAEHAITLAANNLVGNSSGVTGAATEVPCTAQGRSILAAATLADLIALGIPLFTTGDVKFTIKESADTGWIMCNDGTIGNVSSGATFASAAAEALYTLFWANISNTFAPVTGGRGASAAADWAAQKPLAMTKMVGRVLAVTSTSAGAGLTLRALGQALGEEAHQLVVGELPSHSHFITDQQHRHGLIGGNTPGAGSSFARAVDTVTTLNTDFQFTGITGTNNTGSDVAHNIMQPTTFINAMIKL